jgi:hypothetical protein
MDLAGRINALIDRYFGGNALKASRAWRVSQPTVHRLAAGKTSSPRARSLVPIADYHGTTVKWLLEGQGPNPLETPALPMVEYLEFRDVVKQLRLDRETEWAVMSLPAGPGAAHSVLCTWGVGYPEGSGQGTIYTEVPPGVARVARDAAWKAAALQYQSWAYLLEGLMRAYGVRRVRDKLKSELQRVQLGFHPVALELLHEASAPEILRAMLARVHTGGPQAGVTLYDLPAIPPLDAVPSTELAPRRGRPRKTKPHLRYDED